MEGPNTPKICLEMGSGGLAAGNFDDAGIRRVTQLGVSYVLTGGPDSMGRSGASRPHGEAQGRRHHALQHDDRRVPEHDIRQAGTR